MNSLNNIFPKYLVALILVLARIDVFCLASFIGGHWSVTTFLMTNQ